MVDVQSLCDDGKKFATEAVKYDQAGDIEQAIFFYSEASDALLKACSADESLNVRNTVKKYIARAEELHKYKGNDNEKKPLKSSQQKDLEKAHFFLQQGLAEDEKGRKDEAIPLYTNAADICLKACKGLEEGDLKSKLQSLARNAIERAEAIKSKSPAKKDTQLQSSLPSTSSGNQNKISKKPSLTDKELEVLKKTSYINGKKYLPWLDIDVREKFDYVLDMFSDPDGNLPLSVKQKSRFVKWVRPSELTDNPKMIYAISSLSIRQTVVTDCSFVASLAISAAYERKFRKRIITKIIYPQNRNGDPVINPSGKYMIKLWVNGVSRKIIIDDKLPLGDDGKLLCSYSMNKNEMWVSLIEKAYLKVMGGYDFPGSNSNIDLYALTGWIPERVSIKLDDPDAELDTLFNRLFVGLHQGECLITVATGNLGDLVAERAGLVPTHAYAVLDIRKIKNLKLLQLKNPWTHLRWKGAYSENDKENWTPELQKALNFDRNSAIRVDNGVFWIDWKHLLNYFDVLYVNWNPKTFLNRYVLHSTWKSADGPVRDSYNLGENPQYKLQINVTSEKSPVVWILLSRHILDRDDFANNKEFITVHVYKSSGQRIYHQENCYIEGIKINSPHYLVKLKADKTTNTFTLVISQYEKHNTIHYTLKVFSSADFKISPVPNPYICHKQETGEWKGITAGGCANYPATFGNNPVYFCELEESASSKTLSVCVKIRGPRTGFNVLEMSDVPPGSYHIIPTTFQPHCEGPFILEVSSSAKLTLRKL
ncbi:calpain-7-like isoform X2 [Xenia sp. Carnegie-2017]|uniref:calpain-7-like isoform X2 n=1 Tax=Xenia sp. Carnegie-2017 TaxID=2897299 RepID=UPI001F036F6C|nr:calpain-7-like isoform X2 [Xenia sp. Carnegie-2017]